MTTQVAQFHGTCDGCAGRVEPGDEIVNVGGAWEHANCDRANDRPPGYSGTGPARMPVLQRATCPECHLELPMSGVCC